MLCQRSCGDRAGNGGGDEVLHVAIDELPLEPGARQVSAGAAASDSGDEWFGGAPAGIGSFCGWPCRTAPCERSGVLADNGVCHKVPQFAGGRRQLEPAVMRDCAGGAASNS